MSDVKKVAGSVAALFPVQALGTALFGGPAYVAVEARRQAKKMKSAMARAGAGEVSKQMFKDAASPKQIILGHPVLSGPMIFASEEGAPNDEGVGEWANVVIHLAGHVCDDVTHAWLDDELLTRQASTTSGADIEFRHKNGAGFIYIYLGDHNKVPTTLADLPDWDASMRGDQQCFAHVKLRSDPDKWPSNLPNAKFAVKGMRLFDPRTGQTQWSDNPALMVRWYRTELKLGVPMDDTYITAANICDELVSTPSGSEKRYRCNYAFFADTSPRQVLQTIRSTCAGESLRVAARHAMQVGAFYGPGVVTLNEDDVVGDITVNPDVRRRDLINTVSAKYTDPEDNWNEVDMPIFSHVGYVAQDGYEVVDDLDLAAVPSPYQAQRLAKIHLLTIRDALTISFSCTLKAMQLLPGTVFRFDFSENEWQGVEFIVTEWKHSKDGVVALEARQTKLSHYEFNGGTAKVPERPGLPNLVSREVEAVTHLTYTTLFDSNTLQALITWQHRSLGGTSFELSFYKDGEFLRKENVIDKQYRLQDGFSVGQYEVRVVAIGYERRSPVASLAFNAAAPQTPISCEVNAGNWALELLPVSAGAVNFDTMYDFALGFEEAVPDAELESFIVGRAKVITASNLKANTLYHVAVREVSRWGMSSWYRTSAQTTFNSDDVLEVINGQITQEHLNEGLNDFLTQVDERSKDTLINVGQLTSSVNQVQQLSSNLGSEVLGLTSSVSAIQQEYQRRLLLGEAMIGAVVMVDPESGKIINLAFNYADQKFTQAGLEIDGVKASVTIQAQEIKRVETEAGNRISNAEAEIKVNAGLISQKASYNEVTEIVTGALDAITPAKSWQFNTTNEGWSGATWQAGGYVSGVAFSIDSLGINADENPVIRIRAKANSSGRLSWNNGSQNIEIKRTAVSDDFETIIIKLTESDGWLGTIDSLQINFDATIDFIEVGKPSAAEQALSDLSARTTQIEQVLDPANARWGVYVTQEYWENNALTLTDVQEEIDAFEAQWKISAVFQKLSDNETIEKANSAQSWVNAAQSNITDVVVSYNAQPGGIDEQLSDTSDQLNVAQQKIDALENSITDTVTSISNVENALNVDPQLGLNEILGAYQDFIHTQGGQQQQIGLSYAERKIQAHSTALESQAQSVLLLGAAQGEQQATLTQFQHALANQQQALTESNEILKAEITKGDSTTLASANNYTRAAVGYCVDKNGNVTSHTDAVACVAAGHSWLDGPLAEFIRNLQVDNGSGQTASISQLMQVFEDVDGNLIARGGLIVNNQGRITGLVNTNDGTTTSLDLIAEHFRVGDQDASGNFIPTLYIDSTSKKMVFKGRLILDDGEIISSRDELKGDDGQNGADGLNGRDGVDGKDGLNGSDGKPGTIWGTLKLRGGVFPSDALATADFTSRYGRAPILDDLLTYVSNDELVSSVKSFNGSTWVAPALRLNGNIITPGTIYGNRIVAGSEITAPVIKGGTGWFEGSVYAREIIGVQSMKAMASMEPGSDPLWMTVPTIANYSFGGTALLFQKISEVMVPQADFERSLQVEVYIPHIQDVGGASGGQFNETIVNQWSYPHRASLTFRLVPKSTVPSGYPTDSIYVGSNLFMFGRLFGTDYGYRLTNSVFIDLALPATGITGTTSPESFPPVVYELQVALRPRAEQSTTEHELRLSEMMVSATLSKSDAYDFSVEILQ